VTAPAAVDIRDLRVRFGETTAVDDVDLEVGAGEVFGLLGPNGSGKTTALRLMLGFLLCAPFLDAPTGFSAAADLILHHGKIAAVDERFSKWRAGIRKCDSKTLDSMASSSRRAAH